MEPTRRDCLRQTSTLLAGGFFLGSLLPAGARGDEGDAVDVCVYGATASGIMAAVAATREGARVVVIEPSRWLGGMTGGGLSHVDWGRGEAVGGTARGILKRGFNDAQYRDYFRDLLAEHRIPVVFEHRVTAVERDGAVVLVDPASLDLLAGSELDYSDALMGAHFTVRNPNAASACGCGTSFSVE